MVFRHVSYSSQWYLKSFFPFRMNLRNKLDYQVRCCPTISQFKTTLMSIIRQSKKSLFGITNRHQSVLITRLRVNFSGLNERRFRHNFSCEVLYVTVRKESNQLFFFSYTAHSTKFIGITCLAKYQICLIMM